MGMNNQKLTKQELNAISWRYILGSQLNWNYERMMSSGYLYGILPVLKKFYGNDESHLQDMMRTHNQFFNTNAIFGNLIMGIDVAIEEEDGYKAKDTIIALKTALMGSLAGVGDSLFHVIWGTIFGSIAGTLAQSGSIVGCVIWVIANIVLLFGRAALLPLGYKQGVKLVTTLKNKLSAFTNAATVLGVTVIGALIPSVVKATVPFVYKKRWCGISYSRYIRRYFTLSCSGVTCFINLLDVGTKEIEFHTSNLDHFDSFHCIKCVWYFSLKRKSEIRPFTYLSKK